jgi:hypothetical protein
MMKAFPAGARRICLALTMFVAASCVVAQQRPLTRHFVASVEERYQVTLTLRAESHSVTTETVAAQTYVTPVVHAAEVSLHWRADRKILSIQDDGSAAIEETLVPASQQCEESPPSEKTDAALQSSLKAFCTFWLKAEIIQYAESNRGVLRDTTANGSENTLPPLAETAPPLLSLWLKRGVRPNVILPQLPFEIGATSQQSIQPASNLLKKARGSETTEWLDAEGETPAATLHVVQQLVWSAAPPAAAVRVESHESQTQKDESFFADSLSTVSLQDGGLLRANRSASRTTSRHVDPVPGLPQPPEFSSKLTVTVTIERLP